MSALDSIKPFYSILPQVTNPERKLGFKDKLKWTGIILVLYFILTEVSLYGLSPTAIDQFAQLRSVMAGSFGSILTLGIGPIVTASIVMQLLEATELIPYLTDLRNQGGMGRTKLNQITRYVGIALAFIQGYMYSFAFIQNGTPADYMTFMFLNSI